MREAIGELDGLIDTGAALASWEESLAAPYDGRDAWVHSDLTPSNMLVSAEGRLTAVLDFETCGVGDPACSPCGTYCPRMSATSSERSWTWTMRRGSADAGACCRRP
ncbi:phosphotransferase [Kribbella sp. HUAS MG21]|uniref:Phosphotransferase n=1 Tax=Kribbella sp. HUAS MG21 TaxID=3160966 RepID=A0AAU7TCJ0_9ACTN